LVHEIQKERGFTAGYLASGKQKFVVELKQQREITNTKLDDLQKNIQSLDNEILEYLNNLDIINNLAKIQSLRSSIDDNKISAIDAISQYTKIIKNQIQLNRINMDKSAEFEDLYKLTKSLYNFTQIKENYGQLRANINRIATADSVDYNGYQNVTRLYHNNNLLKDEFDKYATEDLTLHIKELSNKEIYNKVNTIIEKVLTHYGKKGLSITPTVWFNDATTYINELSTIEESMFINILKIAGSLQDSNYSKFITYTILIVVILIIIIWFNVYITLSTSNKIKVATNLIREISQGNLKITI